MRKDVKKDRDGGIEGLPLQLLIIVLVAGVGSAIILGWMGGLEAPASIGSVHASTNEIILQDEDGDGLYSTELLELCFTVLDQEGDPVPGASVVLDGSGIVGNEGRRPHATTDSEGKAYFEGLSLSRVNGSIGFVTVTVAKSGIPSIRSISVPVVCE